MIPGAEMRARLDDRIGVWAVTYLLFGRKARPGAGAVRGPRVRSSGSAADGCKGCPAVPLAFHAHQAGRPLIPRASGLGEGRRPSASTP